MFNLLFKVKCLGCEYIHLWVGYLRFIFQAKQVFTFLEKYVRCLRFVLLLCHGSLSTKYFELHGDRNGGLYYGVG